MNKIIIATVLVLSAAAAAWYAGHPAPADGDLVLYGNVDVRQVSLAFNGSERIASLAVQEGDHVRAGQVVGKLDTTTLELRIAESRAQANALEQTLARLRAGNRPQELGRARAQTAEAQAEADVAAKSLVRLQGLVQGPTGRAVSLQDVDDAAARSKAAQARLEGARKAQELVQAGARKEDVAQAEAQLEAARAQTAVLEQQLKDAELRAPIAAVVRARLMEAGDMASSQRPVYTLAITDPKWVRAYVRETELGLVKPGMAASIAIDSLPGQAIAGKVGYISSVAEFTPKTVQTEDLRTSLVYEVRVLAEDRDDRLRLGMPATVRIARPAVQAHR